MAAFMQETERRLYGIKNNLEVAEYNIVRSHGGQFKVYGRKW